jgi:glycine cleavage system aminomethyltransferase T
VRAGGAVVGRLRSCAYCFGVGRTVAYAYLPAGLSDDEPLEVEMLAGLVPARIAADVLYDPDQQRVRA